MEAPVFLAIFLSDAEEGHRVTYVSRRHLPGKENLKCIQGERDQGYQDLMEVILT